MKTMIIVDVQNDFTTGGALEVPGGDGIIEPINRIQGKFDLVIATQDWHPPDHGSFASNHKGKEPFDVIDLHGIEQILWPDHCVQGSDGADLHPGLKTDRIEAIFRKGMARDIDSYSGFYDNGHLKSTGLAGYLREKGAADLYFCGLAADICVYFTIKDALAEGFRATLIENATCPLDEEDNERKMRELREQGVDIIGSGALGVAG